MYSYLSSFRKAYQPLRVSKNLEFVTLTPINLKRCSFIKVNSSKYWNSLILSCSIGSDAKLSLKSSFNLAQLES